MKKKLKTPAEVIYIDLEEEINNEKSALLNRKRTRSQTKNEVKFIEVVQVNSKPKLKSNVKNIQNIKNVKNVKKQKNSAKQTEPLEMSEVLEVKKSNLHLHELLKNENLLPEIIQEIVQEAKEKNKIINSEKISKEIATILERIKQKRTLEEEVKSINLKERNKKTCAKDYNFNLQININIKTEHHITIYDLETKSQITNADVLLTILEIASNSDYYMVSYSNNSRYFWADVILYKELKPVFAGYSAETLRKYWRQLTKIADLNKISDLIKMNKKGIDDINPKLQTLINILEDYFSKKISSLDQALLKMVKKHEGVININKISPKPKNVSVLKNIHWNGTNYKESVEEVFRNKKLHSPLLVKKEDKNKIPDENKFIFNIFDNLINELHKEFPKLNKEYLIKVLIATSMNLELAFNYLKDPLNNHQLLFNEIDDLIILTKKGGSEFKALIIEKGINRVEEREDFLIGEL